MRARHNLPQHQILQDPLAYIEYIGNQDRQNTIEAFKDGGKDTILRACVAPGEGMPLRALGYLATLEHLNRVYFPHAQAQLVIAVNAAERVNGPLAKGSRYEVAHQLVDHAMFLPLHVRSRQPPLMLFDNEDVPKIDLGQLQEVLQGTKAEEQLRAQADRRSASHLQYLAAHLISHDTVESVHRIDGGPLPLSTARRIISVGGKFERTFYDARMRCKEFGLQPPNAVAQTGQLITRHATAPPYQFGRQMYHDEFFDPPITDPLAIRDEILDSPMRVRSSGILRDLVHIRDYVNETARAASEASITYEQKEFLVGAVV